MDLQEFIGICQGCIKDYWIDHKGLWEYEFSKRNITLIKYCKNGNGYEAVFKSSKPTTHYYLAKWHEDILVTINVYKQIEDKELVYVNQIQSDGRCCFVYRVKTGE